MKHQPPERNVSRRQLIRTAGATAAGVILLREAIGVPGGHGPSPPPRGRSKGWSTTLPPSGNGSDRAEPSWWMSTARSRRRT